MRALLEVASETGVVAVSDSPAQFPSGLDQAPLLRHLEPRARAGDVFYVVADDPVRFRMEVIADEPPPDGVDTVFEPMGGAFALHVPTGRLAVTAWDRSGQPIEAGDLTLPPGTRALSFFTRRPFDGARHDAEMTALLGADWTYMRRLDRLGLVGCLPLALAGFAAAAGRWAWMSALIPLLAVTWLPSIVLRTRGRYKAAQEKAAAHDRARPHHVLVLTPTSEGAFPGGFVRI